MLLNTMGGYHHEETRYPRSVPQGDALHARQRRHRERYCGRTGVVVKAVKSRNTVWIEFPDGDRYGAYPENVRPA